MDDLSFEPRTIQDSALITGAVEQPRLPCIALMGEFSAGKTTLINFLLGEDLLPTRVTATQLPPVWMSFGERAAHYVDLEGNQHDLDIDNLHSVPVDGVRYIKLFCDADVLLEMDLIDTPGISDPNIPDHYRSAVVEYVDGVIWCTHATQAWRESERSVWATIPGHLQANSILLATRSDKLGERDRGRVRQRLERETGDKFRSIIMFSATDAIRACQAEDEDELMASSGGEALIETLQTIASEVAQASGKSGLSLPNPEAPPCEDAVAQPAVQPARVSPVRPARVEPAQSRRPGRAGPDMVTATEDANTEPTETRVAALSGDDVVATEAGESGGLGQDMAGEADPVESDAEYEDALTAALSDDAEENTGESAETLEEQKSASGRAVAATPAQQSIDMASSVEDDCFEEEEGAEESAEMSSVLDLKKYEISRPSKPDPVSECEDADNIGEESDAAVATREECASDVDQNVAKTTEGNTDLPRPESCDRHSAKEIWADVLAANPVQTVPDLLAAFTRFIETLDERGMMISAHTGDVDMAGEDGETSRLRMLG